MINLPKFLLLLFLSIYSNSIIYSQSIENCISYSSKKIISINNLGVSSIAVGDIDNDYHQDLITTFYDTNKTSWWKKSEGGLFVETLISNYVDKVIDIVTWDEDKNGKLDLLALSASSGEITLFRQLEDNEFGNKIVKRNLLGVNDLYTGPTVPILVCDNENNLEDQLLTIDEDGLGFQVSYYCEETHSFGVSFLFDGTTPNLTKVRPARVLPYEPVLTFQYYYDFIGVAPKDGAIYWWDFNTEVPLVRNTITNNFIGLADFVTTDLNNDSLSDIIAISDSLDQIAAWINNEDQAFSKILISDDFIGASSITYGDLDKNGFQDIIVTSDSLNQVAVWQNMGDLTFDKIIIDNNFVAPSQLVLADLDNDKDLDIISASAETGTIAWWENECVPSQVCTDLMMQIDDNPIPEMEYNAAMNIESSGTIEPNASVIFMGGENIILKTNFHAQAGSNFTAKILECNELTAGNNNVMPPVSMNIANPLNSYKKHSQLKLFPNPVNQELIVTYPFLENRKTQLFITDILGKEILYINSKQVDFRASQQLLISVNHLQNGPYFLTLQTEKETITKKFLIHH